MLSWVADNILFNAGLFVLIYIDSNILKSLLLHESIISKWSVVIGSVSRNIEETLVKPLMKYYPQINFQLVHNNTFKINSYFKFKDVVPTTLRSSIIYCFTCPSCQAGYIGSSTRAFKVRVAEHMGQSSRTGRALHNPPHSSVREHSLKCKVQITTDHFEIIDSCNRSDLRILESMYIKTNKPALNNMLSATPLNIL